MNIQILCKLNHLQACSCSLPTFVSWYVDAQVAHYGELMTSKKCCCIIWAESFILRINVLKDLKCVPIKNDMFPSLSLSSKNFTSFGSLVQWNCIIFDATSGVTGASFFVFNGWTASLYLTIMLIMSSCNHLRNTCLAPFMFSEHVAAISDMATFGLVNHSQFFGLSFSLICLVVSAASIFPYGRINWLGKWLYHVTAANLLCWKDRDVEVFNDIFWTKWFDLENGQNFLHRTTELTVPNFCVAT